MKKRLIVTTALVVLTASTSSIAQQQSFPPNGYAPNANGEQHQDRREHKFEEKKNEIIRNLQNRLSCVEQSHNPEQLHSCFPKRGA